MILCAFQVVIAGCALFVFHGAKLEGTHVIQHCFCCNIFGVNGQRPGKVCCQTLTTHPRHGCYLSILPSEAEDVQTLQTLPQAA